MTGWEVDIEDFVAGTEPVGEPVAAKVAEPVKVEEMVVLSSRDRALPENVQPEIV